MPRPNSLALFLFIVFCTIVVASTVQLIYEYGYGTISAIIVVFIVCFFVLGWSLKTK